MTETVAAWREYLPAYLPMPPADRPLIGVPVLAVVAVELYLLATPEARLAYLQRS